MRQFRLFLGVLLLACGIRSASGFGLLGPFAPWMLQPPLSYQYFSATGAPMAMGEGYRWNVPVITYGYDQSFLDYFGTNGVAAVESAIQVLNDLPRASAVILTNYKTGADRFNYTAVNDNLYDLKTAVLPLLVEQLGLAPPKNALYCLSNLTYNLTDITATYTLLKRNYDPTSFQPTTLVNSAQFGCDLCLWIGGNLFLFGDGSSTGFLYPNGRGMVPNGDAYVSTYLADPVLPQNVPVANQVPEYGPQSGAYNFAGLTLDDVGGLCYLLGTNNVALENLIPGIQGVGTNASNYVTTALRPGLDKITFQRMNFISSNQPVFAAITNQYVDSYFTNGVLHQQTLQRLITQPDILFKANYDGYGAAFRTGTTSWANNGAPLHDGPGVIQGPIVINLNRFGPGILFNNNIYPPPAGSGEPFLGYWGSFDGTTNAPVVYPAVQPVTNFTTFRFYLLSGENVYPNGPSIYSWKMPGQPNALFALQTSTNLTDWVPITTITNLGGTFSYLDIAWTNTPTRFFRTVPQ